MPVSSRRLSAASLLLVASFLGCSRPDGAPPPATSTPAATPAATPEKAAPQAFERMSADARAAQQQAQSASIGVNWAFRYADRVRESGITFKSTPVADAAKDYRASHYDHFTGLCAADVDGDRRVDLLFLNQLGRNELWRNEGDGKFRDITVESGLELVDPISVGGAFGDIDNDGDPDLFLTTVRKGNHLYENDGKGRFTDISKRAGVDYVGHSSGALFFDFDRDGRLDLFVSNVGRYTTDTVGPGGYYVGLDDAFFGQLFPERTETGILYRNLGGNRFEDVTKAMGITDTGWNGDPLITDFNEDAWPDLYLTSMQGDDHYYENRGGKSFVDRTAEVFPKTSWGATGAKFFDWNNDGRLDLYVVDMHSDMPLVPGTLAGENKKSAIPPTTPFLLDGTNNTFGNSFWQNLGESRFEEVSDRIGAENFWPWGVSVGDLNADGYQDVFVAASMSYPWPEQYNLVLLNDKGQQFRDAAFLVGAEPRPKEARTVPYFDLDCSGADGKHKDCFQKTGKTTVMGTVGTRSAVIFDIEGDGDLDIVTSELPGLPQVLVSDLSSRGTVRWIAVTLRGTASNRDGIGARVRVTAGGQSRMQMHDTATGFEGHSLLPLWFGLGDSEAVERIEVTWPSGKEQVVTTGIEANRVIQIVEPSK